MIGETRTLTSSAAPGVYKQLHRKCTFLARFACETRRSVYFVCCLLANVETKPETKIARQACLLAGIRGTIETKCLVNKNKTIISAYKAI